MVGVVSLVVYVVCCCLHSSWQSCTDDAAPRVVDMHGVRVVYMYKEGVYPAYSSKILMLCAILIYMN